MSKVFESATKLILLMFGATLCVAVLYMVFTGKLGADKILELFSSSVLLVLGFYFAYKGDSNTPYAGK